MRPWPPQRPLARRPQARPRRPTAVFAPSSLQQKGKSRVLNPTGQRVSAPHANFARESPPASSAPDLTLPPRGIRPTPRPNLLVRVCFFGHFPVHLDACPAASSFAPFIFLSAHPPSSHLRRSPDLVGEGERLEMKGAPQKAEGEAGRPERGVVWGKGCKGKLQRKRGPQRRGARRVEASGARERADGERFGLGTAVRERRKTSAPWSGGEC